MLQIYAQDLVRLMERLQELEGVLDDRNRFPLSNEIVIEKMAILGEAGISCDALDLPSAKKQMAKLHAVLRTGKAVQYEQLMAIVAELRIRIKEDLEDKIFFCLSERSKIDRFFITATAAGEEGEESFEFLAQRNAHELFHRSISERMEETSDDIVEACRCFVADRYTACVFHLMRVVECGLLEVARIAEIQDDRPSWGVILKRLEKLAYNTKYEDLPVAVRPHIGFIRDLIPRMQAIQHAWRNKMVHVENRLIPTGGVTEEIASDIMSAVEIFMKTLVAELPPRAKPYGI